MPAPMTMVSQSRPRAGSPISQRSFDLGIAPIYVPIAPSDCTERTPRLCPRSFSSPRSPLCHGFPPRDANALITLAAVPPARSGGPENPQSGLILTFLPGTGEPADSAQNSETVACYRPRTRSSDRPGTIGLRHPGRIEREVPMSFSKLSLAIVLVLATSVGTVPAQ